MKKNNLRVLVATLAIVTVAAFNVTNAENTQTEADNNHNNSMKRWESNTEETKAVEGIKEERSVAWFVANSKVARAQNKACYNNPDIKSTPNCINSLHALEIVFAGASGR